MTTDQNNLAASDDASRQSEQPQCACKCGGHKCRCFLLAVLAVAIVGGGAVYWALFLRIYRLEVCRSAMKAIRADKDLQEALGLPIHTVKWPSRAITPSARVEDRETDIQWQIEGPKGRAKAHVTARLMQGKWEIILLEITLAGGKKLSVREAGGSENDALPFNASPQTGVKKSESNAPPPEINLPLPPSEPASDGK